VLGAPVRQHVLQTCRRFSSRSSLAYRFFKPYHLYCTLASKAPDIELRPGRRNADLGGLRTHQARCTPNRTSMRQAAAHTHDITSPNSELILQESTTHLLVFVQPWPHAHYGIVISPTKATLVSSSKTNHVTRAARLDYHMGIRLHVPWTTCTRPVLVLRTQVRDAATYTSARDSAPFRILAIAPVIRS